MSLGIAQILRLQCNKLILENSLEDCARHEDNFLRTANALHVKGDDKYTRSVQCIVFMITGGRIPSITEMSTDEYGLRSMQEIDPVNLRMSSGQWEKLGLLPWGKALDHASMYGTDLSDAGNADSMICGCSWAFRLKSSPKECQRYMKNSPNSLRGILRQ
jgi:hypothetical protein